MLKTLSLIALLLFSAPVFAETVNNADCMETAAGFNLNCTANDISLSEVLPEDITITEPCSYAGDDVTFTAVFNTVLTAKARHDIGIYFDVSGDIEEDGALTGNCSVSSVEYQPDLPWLDLDGINDPRVDEHKASGIQDTCGDIDSNHNPLRPEITITTKCIDNDNNGFLDLPYCTSWRQPGANELCTSPLMESVVGGFSSGVIPGSPSKCNCDSTFNVPVPIPLPELLVDKTVLPETVLEPGGQVTYTVKVSNQGVDPNNAVTLNSLNDNIHGNITLVQGDIVSTNCIVPQILDAGAEFPYTCTFDANIVGNAGVTIPDIVTAIGVDINNREVKGNDDALVTVVGVDPAASLTKTAKSVVVTYEVIVNNESYAESLSVDTLNDDIYGDISYVHDDVKRTDCVLPATIEIKGQIGDSYSCTFDAVATTSPTTDIITATVSDDENIVVNPSDSATVTFE